VPYHQKDPEHFPYGQLVHISFGFDFDFDFDFCDWTFLVCYFPGVYWLAVVKLLGGYVVEMQEKQLHRWQVLE